MPLSDREQRILAEIEHQLRSEDPRLARTVGTKVSVRSPRGRLRYAALGTLVGLVMLFGIVVHIAWGLAGFVLMLVSAVYAGNLLKSLGADRADGLSGQLKGGWGRYVDGRRRPPSDDT